MIKVSEVMRRYVVTVRPNITVSEAARIMSSNRIGSVIIMENSKPISILTADDIVKLVADGKDLNKLKLGSLPKKKLITASPEEDLVAVTRRMVKAGIKRVPVIKDGKLVGILCDKEIMLAEPELLEILSERLKARVNIRFGEEETILGICERCENYSDNLKFVGGEWLCEDCRD